VLSYVTVNTTTSSLPTVTVLGLGIMGSAMARRIKAAGFPLVTYNRNAVTAATFTAEGFTVAKTPAEAVYNADIILCMVSDDKASHDIWLGEHGALLAAKKGSVLIDLSTLSVAWIKALAARAVSHGCELLDSPVAGSKPQANAGELVLFVGGSALALEKVMPVFKVISKSVNHLGPTGSGARMKLINNFLSGVQAASFAEALAIIERSGLDRAKAVDLVMNGTPGSPMIKTMATRMLAPDYDNTNFALRLMAKDLGYAAEEGRTHGVGMITATAAWEVFKKGVDSGLGEKDLSAVAETFRKAR
jgi:3-hydroxyisobutyrate dehydrogenase